MRISANRWIVHELDKLCYLHVDGTHTYHEPDQKQLLEELAASQLRSPEVLVRKAIVQYLDQQQAAADHDDVWNAFDGPRTSRKEFLEEAAAAKRDLDETGLQVTGDAYPCAAKIAYRQRQKILAGKLRLVRLNFTQASTER